MLTTTLTIAGVLVVLASATAFVVLVVQDLRLGRRRSAEPLDADGRRSQEAHEQVEGRRRANRGAAGGGL